MLGEQRSVLVTGGAGFIGSAVVRHLVNHVGCRVCSLDKLTYAGNLTSVREVEGNANYRFVQADVCDRQTVDRVFAEFQPDAVMPVSYTHLRAHET